MQHTVEKTSSVPLRPCCPVFLLCFFSCVAGGVRGASQSPRQRAPQRLAGEVREEDGHGRFRAHWRQYTGRRRAQVTGNIPRIFQGTCQEYSAHLTDHDLSTVDNLDPILPL